MKFNPIQTNQRPRKEKLVQRLWEVVRVVLCFMTPFFMRKWRRFITLLFARICQGGGKYTQFGIACSELPDRLSLECHDWGAIKHWRWSMGLCP